MTEYKNEITGEKLNRFMARYNKASDPARYYDTEEALCRKHGLDRDQLYVFLQITGRLNDDGSHKDRNFIPDKDGLEFGPLVNANGTLNYYNPYWILPFSDVKHKSKLENCMRNSSLGSVSNGIRKVLDIGEDKSKSSRLEYNIKFLKAIYRIVDGELGLIDQNDTSKIKKIIRNSTGKTEYNRVSYDISKILKALRYNEDYVSNSLIDPRDILGDSQSIKLIEPKKKIQPVVESFSKTEICSKKALEGFECYALLGFRVDGTSVSKYYFNTAKDKAALIGLMPSI